MAPVDRSMLIGAATPLPLMIFAFVIPINTFSFKEYERGDSSFPLIPRLKRDKISQIKASRTCVLDAENFFQKFSGSGAAWISTLAWGCF